jgi:transposase InsO family protein
MAERRGEPLETPEELGRRVAELYRELSYPSAAKFRAALRKRGITVSADFVKELVADQSVRQLTAPAPRFTGHVTARTVDQRWMGDLIDFTAKTSSKYGLKYIMILQDVFSRFVWAVALENKTETPSQFERIIEQTGKQPEELSTDKGSEWTSAAFQKSLNDRGVRHRMKAAPQDLATLDRAIGTLRAVLSRRTAEGNTAWWQELDAAVKSMNESEHPALFEHEPREIHKRRTRFKDVRFDIRYKNAEMAAENQEAAEERGIRLQAQMAFRTLLPPKTGFRRRAGQQNWSEKIHTVASVEGGRVVDTDGTSFPMSTVVAVPATSTSTAMTSFAEGGSTKIDGKRRTAMRPWLQDMKDEVGRAGSEGMELAQLSKRMREKPGFEQQLKDQRAKLVQILRLFPQSFVIEQARKSIKVKLASARVAEAS